MKKKILPLLLFPLLLLSASLAACNRTPKNVDSYEINKTSITLTVGQTTQLSVTKNGNPFSDVTWSSDNQTYASVTSNGFVSALKVHNKVTISARINEQTTLKCFVKVIAGADKYEINKTSISLTIGETFQLSVTKNGVPFTDVTWSSDNPVYANVSESGLVSAYYELNSFIRITATINSKTSLGCDVAVSAPNTQIYQLFSSKGQGSINEDNSHILFIFLKAGTRIDGNNTYIYNLSFQYDTFTNICTIVSRLSWTQDGYDCVLIGYNIFKWGEYEKGLFGGYYLQTKSGSENTRTFEVSFPNEYLTFSYYYQEIYANGGSITYIVEENYWSGSDMSSTVSTIFVRVQECPLYAKEIFETHNYNLKLINN